MINANHNDEVEIVEEDLSKLDDTTDWKAKAQEIEQKRREDGIRSRERTKAFKEKLAAFEAKPQDKIDKTKPNEDLLKKYDSLALEIAGIKDTDEVELVNKWKSETGREVDEIRKSKVFQSELQSLRDEKANALATSVKKVGGGQGQAKDTPEYWQTKGVPPTADQVPDRKTRAKIARAMMKNSGTSGKTFYND